MLHRTAHRHLATYPHRTEPGISPYALMQKYYKDNFKKPELEQVSGITVRFKPENFHHDTVSVNWEDLYLVLNLKAFDASIARSCSL
jgi:hypothetical protein